MTDLVRLHLEKPVHGGYCLARHDGRVILVRHGAPGEEVLARLTDTGKTWRAEVVNVVTPHPDRVPVAWEDAGPGGVGAELAHLRRSAQLEWKRGVIDDALTRIGRLDLPITVTAPDDGDGWHTRTRIELTTNADGQAGMYAYRTRAHVPLTRMPLAHRDLDALDMFSTRWPSNVRLTAVAPSADDPVLLVDGRAPSGHPGKIRERVGEFEYSLAASGFWQAHVDAPQILTDAVLAAAGDISGATIFDLFSGAGLFTLPLAAAVGEAGAVHSVEGNRSAVTWARVNTKALRQVTTHRGDVASVLKSGKLPARADVVVLDPPRVGARKDVMDAIIAHRPRSIVYVSCDPAALARDLAIAADSGYEADGVEAFDLFPHTHHVESLAVLRPST